MALRKDLRPLFALATENGWVADETRDGHPRLIAPRGMIDPYTGRLAADVVFSKTPSDHRGDKNSRAILKRLGALNPKDSP